MDYELIFKEISEKIKRLREDRNMTQEGVSGTEMGVRVYQNIESGKGHPSLKSLIIIADSLGLHPSELLKVPSLNSKPTRKDFPQRKRR